MQGEYHEDEHLCRQWLESLFMKLCKSEKGTIHKWDTPAGTLGVDDLSELKAFEGHSFMAKYNLNTCMPVFTNKQEKIVSMQ